MKQESFVLVVDDEEGIREILVEELTARQFQVVAAKDGKEALELIRSKPPKVIISDYSMPGLNGLELLRFLGDLGLSIPVIWLTGVASRKIILEAWRLGVYDFFEKPFNADFISDQIRVAMELTPEALASRKPRFITQQYFKNLQVDLERSLFEKLEALCLGQGHSMSRFVAKLIEEKLGSQDS